MSVTLFTFTVTYGIYKVNEVQTYSILEVILDKIHYITKEIIHFLLL